MAEAVKKEAKQGAGEEDPSMEDILQSIRRIIAEDGEETKGAVNTPTAPNPTKATAAAPVANGAESNAPPGSDVLELTEMLKDDGSVVSLKNQPAAAAPAAAPAAKPAAATPPPAAPTPPAPPPAKAAAPGDVLNKIDEALATPAAAPAAPPTTAAAATPKAAPIPADALLSEQAAQAAVASFKKLKVEEPLPPLVTTPSPTFTSGASVETMVVQMLMPMIKQWLDDNLPAIVERIVEREVRKISRQ
jgi:uncharacterized protein